MNKSKIISFLTSLLAISISAAVISLTTGCSKGFNPPPCCGGYGDGSETSDLNHRELAKIFVDELNASGEHEVTTAKDSTDKYNYIVIKDVKTGEFTAINIDKFEPGTDAADYLASSAARNYFNLTEIPAHQEYVEVYVQDADCDCQKSYFELQQIPTRYKDNSSGFLFEKSKQKNKDLEKFAALAEEAHLQMASSDIVTRFGLSVERAKEVVRLGTAWRKQGGKDLTAKDQDAFSQELLGFSMTEAMKATENFHKGDKASLETLIEKAAKTNSTTPENMRQILESYTGIK
jgi:hypothetical protein